MTDWTPDEERVARALEPDAWLNRDVVFSEDIETGLRVVLPSIHAARRAIAAMQPRWRDVKTDSPPRDGTEILLYGRCSFEGMFYSPACHVGWWHNGMWMTRDLPCEPSHWSPLPPAPEPKP